MNAPDRRRPTLGVHPPGPGQAGAAFFREMLPLVAFSGLAVPAAGTLIGLALLVPAAGAGPEAVRAAALGAAVALAAGLVLSLGHLGRRERMLLALRGLGRSRLSAEVGLAGLTLVTALAVAASAGPGTSPPPPLLLSLGGTAGLLLLAALAWVYALPAQPAWNGPAIPAPVLLGLAWGLLTVPELLTGPPFDPTAPLAAVLGTDLICFVLRLRRIRRSVAGATAAWPHLMRRRAALALLRLAVVDLLPFSLAAAGAVVAAVGVLATGIFLERVLFYGFALKQTTEAEVDRMEALMQGASDGRIAP
jgi:DMSO reductase anchor subunit